MWYNAHMASGALRDFIATRPHLIWYSKDYDRLDESAIVEATLNYGNWNDVQEMIRILGMDTVAGIFKMQTSRPRKNYRPEVVHYFSLYFDKYAAHA